MSVMPGAEPLSGDGHGEHATVGVLFCHGFTGTPQGLRPWAEAVAAEGYRVRLPLLPGHGQAWRDLAATDWTDWYGEVEAAFVDLRAQCRTVVVAGLSMGGALALRLAEVYPDDVGGVIVVNPSILSTDRRMVLLPLMRRMRRSVAAIGGDVRMAGARELAYERVALAGVAALTRLWRVVRADLAQVTAPVLLVRSAHDRVVPAASCRAVLAGVSSSVREEVVLPDSGHVAPLDHDAATLIRQSLRFVGAVAAAHHPRQAQAGGRQ